MTARIYVASSWRNTVQPEVVAALREDGHDVYDFKHPDGAEDGFHWSAVMPSYQRVGPGMPEQLADAYEYLNALDHPAADAGFANDFDAMKRSDACVLVLPCGRSAHLEAGWFIGQNRPTAILLDGPSVTPELMYKLAEFVALDLDGIRAWAKQL